MESLKMRAGLLLGMSIATAILTSCKKTELPARKYVSGALIQSDAKDVGDSRLWNQIEQASPSDFLQLLKELNSFDHVANVNSIPKEEFETTAHHSQVMQAEYDKQQIPYPHRCFATVDTGYFTYDADRRLALVSDTSTMIESKASETHVFENIQFDDGKATKSVPLAVNLGVETAKTLRSLVDSRDDMEEKGELEIIRVFSLAGRRKPAVEGWNDLDDPFLKLNPTSNDFDEAAKAIQAQTFKVHADLLLVEVVSKQIGGFKKPLFRWRSGENKC